MIDHRIHEFVCSAELRANCKSLGRTINREKENSGGCNGWLFSQYKHTKLRFRLPSHYKRLRTKTKLKIIANKPAGFLWFACIHMGTHDNKQPHLSEILENSWCASTRNPGIGIGIGDRDAEFVSHGTRETTCPKGSALQASAGLPILFLGVLLVCSLRAAKKPRA